MKLLIRVQSSYVSIHEPPFLTSHTNPKRKQGLVTG